jgi:translation initiation factor IF-3
MARANNMDLVCFKDDNRNELPLCKIVSFSKWKYAEEKNKKKLKMQNRKDTKEIRFTPDICENDIGHKMRQAKEFLHRGDDVVLSMQMRGRQRIYAEEAEKKLNDIVAMCNDCGKEVSRNKTDNGIIVKIAKISI